MVRRLLVAALLVASAPRLSAQTGSAPYVGANFAGRTVSDSGYKPPDTMGAVGVNQFAQFLNGTTAVYNKDGTLTLGQTDTAFWAAAGTALTPAGDSRVLYDPTARRWVATAFTGDPTNNSILVARTDGPDALGPWRAVSIQTTGDTFADFPMLGMNGDAFQVSTNNFSTSGVGQNVSVFNIPKAGLYAATPSLTNLTRLESVDPSLTGYAAHPVVSYDPTTTGSTFLLSRYNSTNIARSTLTGTAAAGTTLSTSPSFYTTAAVSSPPMAPQPGTTTTHDTGDTRHSSSPVQLGHRLFVVSTTGVTAGGGSVAGIRFTVLNATNTTVVAQQTLAASGSYFSYPSVGLNTLGDVVIGFTATLPGPLPSSYPAGVPAASAAVIVGAETSPGVFQFRTDASGNPLPTLLQNGAGGYLGGRWGDYSATTPDPADPRVFWTTQEFSNNPAGADYNWATQVSEVIVPNAGEARWQPSASGSRAFADPANWYNGAAPTASQNVVFSRWTSTANSQTVTTSANVTVDRLSVRQTGAGTLTLSLALGTTFTLSNTGTATPSLAVAEYQGQAQLTVTGGGILAAQTAIVAGTAGGTGVLTVDGGVLTTAGSLYLGGTSTAAGGQGTFALSNGATATLTGPLVAYAASSAALTNTVSVGSASTLTAGGLVSTGAQTVLPAVALTAASSRLVLNPAGTSSFAGVISGSGGLTVAGPGTQQLAGANSYTGTTTVTAGTLALTGTGSIATSPTVTVGTAVSSTATLDVTGVTGGFGLGSGQTLRGAGTVTGNVAVGPGTLQGGNSGSASGTLSITGAVTATTGSTVQVAVGGSGASTQVAVSGAFTRASAADRFTVALQPDGTLPLTSQVPAVGPWTVLSFGSSDLPTGVYTSATSNAPFTVVLADGTPLTDWAATVGANNLVVSSFTPVPEPTTVLLVAAGGLWAWRRRR